MKKRLMRMMWILIFFGSFTIAKADEKIGDVFATNANHQIVNTDKKLPIVLRKCVSEEVGISFACDPTWKLRNEGKKFTVTINEVPRVEMTIEESEQTTHFISELSQDAFRSMGRYEDGFHFEHLTYCHRETIKINGYLKGHSDARVSDFYLLDHLNLHSVKFTVDPKESWESYKWLIKEIIDSVRFVRQDKELRFPQDGIEEDTCEELVK